ncbi:hypothetical protein OpiT1DRAFT_01264 [Opitutaceae bacterium TAV1]|nr:hypothetical protein OpiT1DRAFT_01264 [Opitutaceae bacterium TAV1]
MSAIFPLLFLAGIAIGMGAQIALTRWRNRNRRPCYGTLDLRRPRK